MQTHLDFRTCINPSPNSSLYNWSIVEISNDGKERRSIEFIPWRSTLYFDLKKAIYRAKIEGGTNIVVNEHLEPTIENINPTYSERIYAEIIPSTKLGEHTRYSMFGTDRLVESFVLFIEAIDQDQTEECRLYGGVKYTYELNFREETQPDYLEIHIYLKENNFQNIAECFKQARYIDSGILSLKMVSGFYAAWSPLITTELIKILTDKDQHQLEFPDSFKIMPPSLGLVGGFELTLSRDLFDVKRV